MKSSKNRDILADLRTVFLSFISCACLLPGSILTHLGFSKKGEEKKKEKNPCSALFRAGSKQVIMKAGDQRAAVSETSC